MSYQRIQSYFFLTFLVGIFGILVYLFMPYIEGLVIALTLAVIFWPIYTRIVNFLNGRKTLSSVITVALITFVIITPFAFIASQATIEVRNVYKEIVTGDNTIGVHALENLQNMISKFTMTKDVSLISIVEAGSNWIASNLGSIFSSATSLFINLLISIIALFYIFKNGEELKNVAIRISPLADKYDRQIIDKLGLAINSVIRGAIMVAIIQGALTGFGFFIFGVPNPTLWGSLTVLAALIPTFGTSIIIVPAILYLVVTGQSASAVGLLIWGSVAVGLIDNLLGPQLMKRGMVLNPFLILLSVLGGVTAFGPIGFIIGPMILSIFIVLLDIYKKEFREYLEKQV